MHTTPPPSLPAFSPARCEHKADGEGNHGTHPNQCATARPLAFDRTAALTITPTPCFVIKFCAAQVTYTYADGMNEAECLELCASVDTCVAFTIDKHRCGIAESCKYRTTIDADAVTQTYVKPSQVESNAELFANLQTTAPWKNPAALYDRADKCAFCDPTEHGPCFDRPICRMGKCFRGTQLPDGRNCDDKDQTTINDRCHKGSCRGEAILVLPLSDHQGACMLLAIGTPSSNSANSRARALAAVHAAPVGMTPPLPPLAPRNGPRCLTAASLCFLWRGSGFEIIKGKGCVMHYEVIASTGNVEVCSARCSDDEKCSSFSLDTKLSRCMLFAQAKCNMKRSAWISGIKRTDPSRFPVFQ